MSSSLTLWCHPVLRLLYIMEFKKFSMELFCRWVCCFNQSMLQVLSLEPLRLQEINKLFLQWDELVRAPQWCSEWSFISKLSFFFLSEVSVFHNTFWSLKGIQCSLVFSCSLSSLFVAIGVSFFFMSFWDVSAMFLYTDNGQCQNLPIVGKFYTSNPDNCGANYSIRV